MREWMIQIRKAKGLSVDEMAARCECSPMLLNWLEQSKGIITHPHIASCIAAEYGLTVKQYNSLIADKHRRDKLPKRHSPPKATPQYFPNIQEKGDM